MNKLLLLTAAAATLGLSGPSLAQSPFRDVPPQHWASGAVKELQLRGILNGYQDGTFGGKRAVTRYEFALASQRALQEIQRRIDAVAAAPHPSSATPLASRAEVDARIEGLQSRVAHLRLDVDGLRGTFSQLQDHAATLRSEVDELKSEVGYMNDRASEVRSQVPLGSRHRR